MSFVYSSTALILPNQNTNDIFGCPEDIWIGIGEDEGLYAFKDTGLLNRYVISKSFHPNIIFEEDVLKPQYSNVNGSFYWESNQYSVFYSLAYEKWILSEKTAGVEPYEGKINTSPDTSSPIGYEFYELNFPASINGEGTLTPRGKNNGNVNYKKITLKWENCWTSGSQCGTYYPFDGNTSGTRKFGTQCWKDAEGNIYSKSISKDESGHYSYGSVSYNEEAEAWIIGEYGSPLGWWQSSTEPSTSGTTTFYYVSLSRSTNEPIVLSYDGVKQGNLVRVVYLGEVSRWY